MADEGDSKSLVLITRVGSTPTTGTRQQLGILHSGLFLFGGRAAKGGCWARRFAILCRP